MPGIEEDASDYVISNDGIAVSGFHPEIVDRIAPTVRTVYEFDPGAEPDSVRHLPAPYNELECQPVFSMLPSIDANTEPLPEAAVDVLVHERRPDPVPKAISERLASCANLNRSELESNQYTMTFNVYVDDNGQATSALLVDSTLGDHPTERCIVEVLRSAQWPSVTANLAAASEPKLRGTFVGLAPPEAPLGVKSFFAQPVPNQPPLTVGDRPSGVYKIQPSPAPPAGGGPRVPPGVFVLPLSPAGVAILVFGTVIFWPSSSAPGCATEMNPETGKPYTSRQEYDEVQGRRSQKLLKRRPWRIRDALRKPPPAAAPPPAPVPPPATGTRRNLGQTCEDAELDRLEAEKDKVCKPEGGFAATCGGGKINAKKLPLIPCSAVRRSLQQRQACLDARWVVQNKCFDGKPDKRHKDEIDNVQNGVNHCKALELINCAPGHPMAEL